MVSLIGCSSKKILLENIDYSDRVEYGSELTACEIIESIDGKELIEKNGSNVFDANGHRVSCSNIDTRKIGKQKLYVDVDKQLFVLDITVSDTEKPVIKADSEIDIKNFPSNEEEFDIESYFEIEDSSEYETKIIGEVNLHENGKYPVTIVATDKYGNESTKDITFNVDLKENKPEEKPAIRPSVKPTNKGNDSSQQSADQNNSEPVPPSPSPVPPSPNPAPVPPPIQCVPGEKTVNGVSDYNAICEMARQIALDNHASWTEVTMGNAQDEWIIKWYCN